MRSRLVIGVVLFAALAAGCSWFPGGRSTTEPRAAVASAGCAAGTARAAGTEEVTTTSSGVARTYLRRIPTGYDAKNPLPVIVDFHGYGEGAQLHSITSEWGPRADAAHFVVIYPQGLGATPRWDAALGSADLTFFSNLLDEVEAGVCVDQRRVFVTGYSMGAFLTSSIACQFADRVAAVGIVDGIRNPTGCAPSRPMPLVTFHGTLDTFVDYAPVPATVAAWATRNKCFPKALEDSIASDVVLTRYLCPTGSEVGFYRVDGGGHTWPGSEFSKQIASVVGYTTFSIHASDIMWDFFERHPLPAPTAG